MKKYIIAILVFVNTISRNYLAQTDCDHNVSTKYTNPTNSSLRKRFDPVNPTILIDDTRYLNRFTLNNRSLVDQTYLNYSSSLPYNNVLTIPVMLNVMNDQTGPFMEHIWAAEEMNYENGWEVLSVNLGLFPDNITTNSDPSHAQIPYIMVYNRYSSTIRLFANYGLGQISGQGLSIDAMKVTLAFNETAPKSGLMRLASGFDVTLDQTTNSKRIVAISKHPNQAGRWFTADFQVMYDPCTCFYTSQFHVEFEAIETETIKLQGRTVSSEQDIVEGNVTKVKDYLTNFDFDSSNASGGSILYRDIASMWTDYQNKLELYKSDLISIGEENKLIERQIAIAEAVKKLAVLGVSAALTEVGGQIWVAKLLQFAEDLVGSDSIKVSDLVKEGEKGFASFAKSYIAKNFQKKPLPKAPNTLPTVTFSESFYSGEITNNTGSSSLNMLSPGVYRSQNYLDEKTVGGVTDYSLPTTFTYPTYNDVLGTFALLESPKIELHNQITDVDYKYALNYNMNYYVNSSGGIDSINTTRDQEYNAWTTNYQIKLKEPLKYAFNTVLDYNPENVEIKAAFKINSVLVQDNPTLTPSDNQIYEARYAYIDPIRTVNFEGTNSDVSRFFPLKNGGNHQVHRNQIPFELTGLTYPITGNISYGTYTSYTGNTTKDKTALSFLTSFYPLNSFLPVISSLGIRSERVSSKRLNGITTFPSNNPVVDGFHVNNTYELILMVTMKFNTLQANGEPNAVTQAFHYNIDNITTFNTLITSGYGPNAIDITSINENLIIGTTNFAGQPVPNCVLVGNTYTCTGLNTATVKGNLTTSNGYKVKIRARNKVFMNPESNVGPEIQLYIEEVLNFSQPMPQQTQAQVKTFCTNNVTGYKANIGTKSIKASIQNESENLDKNINQNPFSFNLFPNPATQETTIRLTNAYNNEAMVKVFDITGKELVVEITKTENDLRVLNLATLQAGIYLVKVETCGETQTKQLVVK